MIYTLHGDKSILYEIVVTDLPKEYVQVKWDEYYRDENGVCFQTWCNSRRIPLFVVHSETIFKSDG